jgi:predicted permease
MKRSEAWHLSRTAYQEAVYRSLAEERGRMWWGAFGHSHHSGGEDQDDRELAKRALRIAKFDKMIVAVFNTLISMVSYATMLLEGDVSSLASSVSLSLAVTFGFTTLYAIQTLSSFVSTDSSALLSTLPIEDDDSSLITVFSFIRSVDYIVVGSILSQVIAVVYLTGSPLATLIILAASTMNELFAVATALWFSRTFQRNLLRGGRSKASTILRLVFILMWGLLLVGVGFLLSIPWAIVPSLDNLLLGIGHLSNFLVLVLIYPFSAGILVADIVHPSIASTFVPLASAVLAGYALLAFLVGRWSLGTVKGLSQGSGVRITRTTTKDFSVKAHSPLLGYVWKDLKIATRNPATAFFFTLPVLETMITAVMASNLEMLRTTTLLSATSMGGIFTLFLPLALLTAEGKGLEYTKTLPISSVRIIVSKTLVSVGTYSLVPAALVGLSLIKPLTSPSVILIPFLMMMAVASASIFEIKLFLSATARGKIAAVVGDIEKLFIGAFIVLLPEAAYAAVFLALLDHSYSLLIMGATALAELAAALYMLRRSQKDDSPDQGPFDRSLKSSSHPRRPQSRALFRY